MNRSFRLFRFSFPLIALGFVASAARADSTLYTNGPTSGTFAGLLINNGAQTEDSFALSSASTLTSVTFGDWVVGGDQALTVDWAIVGSESSQTPLCASCSGTANLSGVFDSSNSLAEVFDETFALPDITLSPGTYWLELQNELLSEGDPAYWDVNGGSSMVWDSSSGDLSNNACNVSSTGTCSNAFTIFGSIDAAMAPESSSIALLGSGAALIVADIRRRRAR